MLREVNGRVPPLPSSWERGPESMQSQPAYAAGVAIAASGVAPVGVIPAS